MLFACILQYSTSMDLLTEMNNCLCKFVLNIFLSTKIGRNNVEIYTFFLHNNYCTCIVVLNVQVPGNNI